MESSGWEDIKLLSVSMTLNVTDSLRKNVNVVSMMMQSQLKYIHKFMPSVEGTSITSAMVLS